MSDDMKGVKLAHDIMETMQEGGVPSEVFVTAIKYIYGRMEEASLEGRPEGAIDVHVMEFPDAIIKIESRVITEEELEELRDEKESA